MRFLRPAAGYGSTDQRSNEAFRHELNILDVCEEMNINKIITDSSSEWQVTEFLGSCLITTRKEEGREADN
jgi:hypothetical protein